MSELEEKLGSLLSDPKMMQQLMGIARMLSGQNESTPPQQTQAAPQKQEDSSTAPDPGLLQAISGIARQSGIDANQQSLLRALQPYLSRDRLSRLERAMGAARMAGAASVFLNSGGLQMLTRR